MVGALVLERLRYGEDAEDALLLLFPQALLVLRNSAKLASALVVLRNSAILAEPSRIAIYRSKHNATFVNCVANIAMAFSHNPPTMRQKRTLTEGEAWNSYT